MKHLLLILGFLSTSCFSQSLWIVGESYIGLSVKDKEPQYFLNVRPTSWAIDKKENRLWIIQENGTIGFLDSKLLFHSKGKARKILTEVEKGTFLTEGENSLLETRNSDGEVTSSKAVDWLYSIKRLVRGENQSWSLHMNPSTNDLWMNHLDSSYNPQKKVVVSEGNYLWSEPRIEWDGLHENLWVGYTAQIPTKLYAPRVKLFAASGELKGESAWQEKGVFFDLCVEKDGTILVSRDVPSNSEFTVPVYSFLERLNSGSINQSKSYYAAHENLFIDSFVCESDRIFMLERSIFGSDGSQILIWDRNRSKDILYKLPSRAWKIYATHIE